MKRISRRYANRRMHDAQSRRSMVLFSTGGLLREGAQVQVIDDTTGMENTILTLSKVLLERAKG